MRWLNHGCTALYKRCPVMWPPPLIVLQVYNLGNSVASTSEFLSLKFNPVYDKPHIVGANME